MHTAMLPLPVDYIQAYKPSLRPIQLRCVIINQCVTSMKNFLRRVNYLSNGDVDLYKTLIGRAHSFPRGGGISSRAAEFGFFPRNFCRGIDRGIRLFTAESR